MRRFPLNAVVLVLVAVAAGCGGGGSSSTASSAGSGQSHTVLDVSKAFSDAGIPFTSEVTWNPYVAGQTVYLPGKLNTSPLRANVQAELSQAPGFTGVEAVVFDTDANAAHVLKVVPLSKWGGSPAPPVVRFHDGNVIIVAFGFRGADKAKLDAALAPLKSS